MRGLKLGAALEIGNRVANQYLSSTSETRLREVGGATLALSYSYVQEIKVSNSRNTRTPIPLGAKSLRARNSSMHKLPPWQEVERLTDQHFELPDQVSLQQLLPGTYTAIFVRAGDLVASVGGGAATGTAQARLRAGKWGSLWAVLRPVPAQRRHPAHSLASPCT